MDLYSPAISSQECLNFGIKGCILRHAQVINIVCFSIQLGVIRGRLSGGQRISTCHYASLRNTQGCALYSFQDVKFGGDLGSLIVNSALMKFPCSTLHERVAEQAWRFCHVGNMDGDIKAKASRCFCVCMFCVLSFQIRFVQNLASINYCRALTFGLNSQKRAVPVLLAAAKADKTHTTQITCISTHMPSVRPTADP